MPRMFSGRIAWIIGTLIVCTLALLGWSILRSERQVQDLGTVTLQRVMDEQLARLTLQLTGVEQSLEQEAFHLEAVGNMDSAAMVQRWRPVLLAQPAITTIGLANESGDERSLRLVGTQFTLITTSRGSERRAPQASSWSFNDRNAASTKAYPAMDPREEPWFSQALEDRHGDPVWSSSPEVDSIGGSLHVSMLLRSEANDKPYRVLRFSLRPDALMHGSIDRSRDYAAIQLSPTGVPFIPLDSTAQGLLWRQALDIWDERKEKFPFTFSRGDNTYVAQVLPCTLQGTEVMIAALVDLGSLEHWTGQQRVRLYLCIGLLVLLGITLLVAYVLNRRTSEQARRQERRSRNRDRELAKAIGEREILDREVHHRVKNNLQVVSSLLNLQAGRITDDASRTEFLRGKRRIDSMALVHHKLYALKNLRSIDLKPFLDDLAKAMQVLYEPDSRSVSHSVETGGVRADADTAIQIGMILCELLANCYQHAFPYATGGHIDISVRHIETDLYRLLVKDNGKGAEQSSRTHASPQLGLEIVEALAEQLDGGSRLSNGAGTAVEVLFRMRATVAE